MSFANHFSMKKKLPAVELCKKKPIENSSESTIFVYRNSLKQFVTEFRYSFFQ